MDSMPIRLIAVAALALCTVPVGQSQASERNVGSQNLVAQAGATGSGGSGATGTRGPAIQTAPTTLGVGSSGSVGTSGTASGSLAGGLVPTQCAGIQNNAAQLQECFDRFYRDGRQ